MHIFKNVKFETAPLMLASWPGMGNVGIISTDYLRSKMNAKVLAEIDMSTYFIPDSIIVEDGLAELPELPRSIIYYSQNPDILIFESNAQISGKNGIAIVKSIVQLAAEYNVQKIFTAAAFSQNLSHNTPPNVLGAFNTKSMLEEFKGLGVNPMPNGYIAGLNGIMLGIAANYNIDAGCLLGTIPSFASNLSYPKASLEIIKIFQKILNIEVDTKELEETIALVDTQFTEIEERIREYYPDVMDDEDEEEFEQWEELYDFDDVDDEEVPRYIMDKIERLFDEVKKDHGKATILKKELDRWKLYELYEHRFLAIFK
jgi:predicted ATP-grasp superfamily ATP-dependent carboligase